MQFQSCLRSESDGNKIVVAPAPARSGYDLRYAANAFLNDGLEATVSLHIPELEPCPFCEYLSGEAPCVFLSRGDAVSAFLNATQYERGASLIVTNQHIESFLAASGEQVEAVYREAQRVAKLLVSALGATGVSVFQNNGRAAGQTVPHYHVHVVPRYPYSDPGRRFREADFGRTSLSELEALAAILDP